MCTRARFHPNPLPTVQDITMIHVQCAECEDVHLCVTCWAQGAESSDVPGHAPTHAYRVWQNPSTFAVYHAEWTAKEELLLLDGIALYGFGNWRCVPAHSCVRARARAIEPRVHYNPSPQRRRAASRRALICRQIANFVDTKTEVQCFKHYSSGMHAAASAGCWAHPCTHAR
ncbi:hypothetical protein EON67_11300 [archaeon]|nr:MAG: hypothetical protein EON67_11300 [archaeon]